LQGNIANLFTCEQTNAFLSRNMGAGRELQVPWTIFVVLAVLWLLGLITSYAMGGFIHILLVLTIVVVLNARHSGAQTDRLTGCGLHLRAERFK